MKLFKGDIAIDDRGQLSFVNDFDFNDVERFYVVQNHRVGEVRGWHGHELEGKYVFVVSGVAKIAWVPIDYLKSKQKPEVTILSANNPEVLFIPPGNYNASQTLAPGTKIIYFSTSTLEESQLDDKRLPKDKFSYIW